MVELTPGSNVYIFRSQLDSALRAGFQKVGEPNDGKRIGRSLLSSIWSAKELQESSSSINTPQGLKQLDQRIIGAIIGKHSPVSHTLLSQWLLLSQRLLYHPQTTPLGWLFPADSSTEGAHIIDSVISQAAIAFDEG